MMMMVMVTSVLPEEADLSKSSKELWVAKVVGVVEDNRGHLHGQSECGLNYFGKVISSTLRLTIRM